MNSALGGALIVCGIGMFIVLASLLVYLAEKNEDDA